MSGLTTGVVALLGLCGLAGGVGITALGPGGVLPTVGLFALTALSPARVAGTAIVTHIATGTLATAAYRRSGQLGGRAARRTALLLAATALVGTPLGVLVNSAVSKRSFGIVLGVVVALVAALVWYRQRRHSGDRAHRAARPPALVAAGLGLAVSAVSGIVGIGGPMLTVPLLIVLGVPVLEALSCAQVESIVIATVGSAGYLVQGAIDWPLAAVIGIPELAGVLLGWKIARSLPTRTLTYGLVAALFALAPYLVLHG
jgi:hypothetical protein